MLCSRWLLRRIPLRLPMISTGLASAFRCSEHLSVDYAFVRIDIGSAILLSLNKHTPGGQVSSISSLTLWLLAGF